MPRLSYITRGTARRYTAAIRGLALSATLLIAVAAACSSEQDDPTATSPATSTSAPTSTPAASATSSAPAASATATSPGATEAPVAAPTATTAPAATPEPEATTTEATADAPPVGINVGNTLPHFEFTLADGSVVSTEALAAQGEPVFLYFFATW